MKKTIIVIIFLSLISKGLGFFRDVIITGYLGIGFESDAILMAISIPTIIFSIVNTSIRTTFSPLFSYNYSQNKVKSLLDFKVLSVFLLVVLFFFLLLLYFNTELILKLLAPGFNGELFNKTNYYLKISILLVFTYGVFQIYAGFLQSIKVFGSSEVAGILNNITVILTTTILLKKIGPISVIYGFVFGSVFQIIYSYGSFRYQTKYIKIKNNQPEGYNVIKKFLKLIKPIFAGSIATQINVFSDKFFASSLQVGSISALHYANLLKNLPLTIFVLTISNVLFPNMAILYKSSKKSFMQFFENQFKFVIFITLYISIIFYSFSHEIITIVFLRGEMTSYAVDMMVAALKAYTLGMVFWAAKESLAKVSYAAEDTKTPTIISFISLVINLVLNAILSRYLGHVGLALATSISFAINSLLLLIILKAKDNLIIPKVIYKNILILISFSIAFTILILKFKSILSMRGFDNPYILFIGGSIIISVIYFIIGGRIGFNYKDEILNSLKKKKFN